MDHHLFLNIISSNFTVGTRRIFWCDRARENFFSNKGRVSPAVGDLGFALWTSGACDFCFVSKWQGCCFVETNALWFFVDPYDILWSLRWVMIGDRYENVTWAMKVWGCEEVPSSFRCIVHLKCRNCVVFGTILFWGGFRLAISCVVHICVASCGSGCLVWLRALGCGILGMHSYSSWALHCSHFDAYMSVCVATYVRLE